MTEKKTLVVEVTPKGIAEAKRQLDELAGAGKRSEDSFGSLAKRIAGWTSVANVAVQAGQALIRGTVELAKQSVVLAAGYEKARITWGVLVGDMERGNEVFNQLRDFATRTPLSFESIESAAQTLKGFGVETSQLIPTLQKLGDMSRGDSSALGGLALVFGQVKAQGRAMTQDLYQFINAGIPIFNMLGESLGVSAGQIKELTAQGKIGFREIEDAINKATSSGGQFAGMMDKTAETASGKWSTAVDNAKNAMADLGTVLLDIVLPALDAFNDAMERGAKIKGIFTAVTEGTSDISKAIADIQGILALAESNRKEFEKQYVKGGQLGFMSTQQIIEMYQRQLDGLIALRERAEREGFSFSDEGRITDIPDAPRSPAGTADWRAKLTDITGIDATGLSGISTVEKYVELLMAGAERAVSFGDALSGVYSDVQGQVRETIEELLDSGLFSEDDQTIKKLREYYVLFGQMMDQEKRAEELSSKGKPTIISGVPGAAGDTNFIVNKELVDLYQRLRDVKDPLVKLQWEEVRAKMEAAGATAIQVEQGRQLFEVTNAQAQLIDEQIRNLERYKQTIEAIQEAFKQAGMNAYVDVFKSLGEAMASGANAGESFALAMGNIGIQLLNQLPMMLLSAGLQAITMGNWPLGLALLGASGLVAVGAGVANTKSATPHANGAAYSSPSLHAYANGVYNSPQFFGWEGSRAFANGGVFAEAGPEAIMPLSRDSSGRLGVRAEGVSASVQVIVNNNAAGTEAKQTEGIGPNGEKQIIVTIESVVKGAIASGKLDGAMARYGVAPKGVRT